MVYFTNTSVYKNSSGKWQNDKRECCTVILAKIETCAKKAILLLRTSLELLTNQYAMPNPHTCSDWLESNWIYTWCTGPKEQRNFLQVTKFGFCFVSGKLVHLMQWKSEVSFLKKVIKILKGRGNKVKINGNKNPWYRVSTWAPDIFY